VKLKLRCLKTIRYGFLSVLSLVVVLAIGCLVPTQWDDRPQSDCGYPIYVSSVNYFHAELIVPVTNAAYDWRSHLNLKELGSEANTYRYLSFGWGDRNFFLKGSFDPLSIFDALFLPSSTVMHVWGHQGLQHLGSAFEVKQIQLSRTQYLKLTTFISEGFQHNQTGEPLYIRQGLYRNSAFYAAVGNYSILRTCNTWTAEGLRRADVNTPLWPALAPAIMHQLKNSCAHLS
jgi:uncharacterized protein (TIGR02117 family)